MVGLMQIGKDETRTQSTQYERVNCEENTGNETGEVKVELGDHPTSAEDQENEDTSCKDVATSFTLNLSFSGMTGMTTMVASMMTPPDKHMMSAVSRSAFAICIIIHFLLAVIMMIRMCLRCKCCKRFRPVDGKDRNNGNLGNGENGVPRSNAWTYWRKIYKKLPTTSFILSVLYIPAMLFYMIATGMHMKDIMSDQSGATPASTDESSFGNYSAVA